MHASQDLLADGKLTEEEHNHCTSLAIILTFYQSCCLASCSPKVTLHLSAVIVCFFIVLITLLLFQGHKCLYLCTDMSIFSPPNGKEIWS